MSRRLVRITSSGSDPTSVKSALVDFCPTPQVLSFGRLLDCSLMFRWHCVLSCATTNSVSRVLCRYFGVGKAQSSTYTDDCPTCCSCTHTCRHMWHPCDGPRSSGRSTKAQGCQFASLLAQEHSARQTRSTSRPRQVYHQQRNTQTRAFSDEENLSQMTESVWSEVQKLPSDLQEIRAHTTKHSSHISRTQTQCLCQTLSKCN